MDTLVLFDQENLTIIRSVGTLGTIKKTFQERWPIGIDSKRVKVIHAVDDDDDDVCIGVCWRV